MGIEERPSAHHESLPVFDSTRALKEKIFREPAAAALSRLADVEIPEDHRKELENKANVLTDLRHHLLDERPIPLEAFRANAVGVPVHPNFVVVGITTVGEGEGVVILRRDEWSMLRTIATLPENVASDLLGSQSLDLQNLRDLSVYVTTDVAERS